VSSMSRRHAPLFRGNRERGGRVKWNKTARKPRCQLISQEVLDDWEKTGSYNRGNGGKVSIAFTDSSPTDYIDEQRNHHQDGRKIGVLFKKGKRGNIGKEEGDQHEKSGGGGRSYA